MIKKLYCDWYFYTDYYESNCGQQIEIEDYENTEPIFCPYCGNEIDLQNEH